MFQKGLNQYLKPDFEPQPVCHFLTYFSLVCTCGNVLKSGLRISKSHVRAAIFGCGFCENMFKKRVEWLNQYLKPDF